MIKLINGFLSLTLVLTGFASISYSQDHELADKEPLKSETINPNLAKTKIQINIGDNNKVIEISEITESEVNVDNNNTQTKEVLTNTTTNDTSTTSTIIDSNNNSNNDITTNETKTETNTQNNTEVNTTTNSEANTITNTETNTTNNTEINNENNAEGNSKIVNDFAPVNIETKSEVVEEAPIVVIVPKPETDEVTEEKPEMIKDETEGNQVVEDTHLDPKPVEDLPETVATPVVAEKPLSRFSLRGTFGFGQFSNFKDITSKYSLGFAVAYDLNEKYNIEFQYIFSQYEDNFDYDFFTQLNTSGYVFDQRELAIILNYKVLPLNGFDVSLRGGFNIISRSAFNNFTGETNTAQGGSAILGAKADVKITRNLSLVGILDYNVGLRSSGYNKVSSPLFLVGGENFLQMNLGLKYQF